MDERRRRTLTRAPATALLLAAGWACGDAAPTAPDPPPDNGEPTPPVVAAVAVSADIGPVLAPGATTRLSATATDAQGGALSAGFTWSSSDPDVVEVTSDGTLTALAPGEATVSAQAEGVSGGVDLTVFDLDVATAEALLDDPMADLLLTALGTEQEAVVRPAWVECREALDLRDVTGLAACLSPLADNLDQDEPVSGPLRTLLTLFTDSLDRLLDGV